MRLRFVAGLSFPVCLFAVTCAMCGCKKQTAATAPPADSAAQAPDAPPPPPPPPYIVPDKLPVHATVAFVKQEEGANIYKATFDSKFEFDPSRALLALDVNTVGWAYHGRLVILNKDNDENAGAQTHEQLYDQPPTTDQFDPPQEHVMLSPVENKWIKEGGVTILIRNAEGADPSAAAAPPKVLTVDLVGQADP